MNGIERIKKQLVRMYGAAEANTYQIWRGYLPSRGSSGWMIQRFGQNTRFLGATLKEALGALREEHEMRIDAMK